VLGSQVGSGNGRRAATVAGAIAGGVAGNQIESRRNQRDIHAVFVRMDDGRRVVLEQRAIDGLYEGARVQVRNGRARRL
jgi:outer membrane lipoprotein SlyB